MAKVGTRSVGPPAGVTPETSRSYTGIVFAAHQETRHGTRRAHETWRYLGCGRLARASRDARG